MSRRKVWKPSAPELVRLKREAPGRWTFYFPGWRSIPSAVWHVERIKQSNGAAFRAPIYEVKTAGIPGVHYRATLAAVRQFIAAHYEYL